MSGKLEEQLGRISGQLQQLQPALDKLEERQTQMGQDIARLQTQAEEYSRQREAIWKRLKEGADTTSARLWDVAKILLAGVLGALLTRAVQWP